MSNRNPAISEFKRLAGMGDGDYVSWRRTSPLSASGTLSEGKGERSAFENVVSLNKAKIRYMARTLDESNGRGGTHLPIFEWEDVRPLYEAEAAAAKVVGHYEKDPFAGNAPKEPSALAKAGHAVGKAVVGHIAGKVAGALGAAVNRHQAAKASVAGHEGAMHATTAAHAADRAGSHELSHQTHSKAAEMHTAAASDLKAKGHHELAYKHAMMAQHHTSHAEYHAGQSAGGAKPGEMAPALHAPAEKAANRKKSDPSMKAHMHSRAIEQLHQDPNASHSELAGEHHEAAKSHLAAAVAHFKKGDVERAQHHFSQSMEHLGQHKFHAARTKGAQPAPKPAGPQAQAGRTRVPGMR